MQRRVPVKPVVAATILALAASLSAQPRAQRPLTSADVDIATLLMLEDARKYDQAELGRILESTHPEVRRRAVQSVGRLADKAGAALIDVARRDADVEVAATAAWAAGQLRDPVAIDWLAQSLMDVVERLELGDTITAARMNRPDR